MVQLLKSVKEIFRINLKFNFIFPQQHLFVLSVSFKFFELFQEELEIAGVKIIYINQKFRCQNIRNSLNSLVVKTNYNDLMFLYHYADTFTKA